MAKTCMNWFDSSIAQLLVYSGMRKIGAFYLWSQLQKCNSVIKCIGDTKWECIVWSLVDFYIILYVKCCNLLWWNPKPNDTFKCGNSYTYNDSSMRKIYMPKMNTFLKLCPQVKCANLSHTTVYQPEQLSSTLLSRF